MGSLQLRIFAAMAIVCIATLLAVGFFSARDTTLQFEQFSSDRDSALVARLQHLLTNDYEKNRNWSGVQPQLQQIGRQEQIGILLYSMQGKLLASSLPDLVNARMSFLPTGEREVRLQRGASGRLSEDILRFQGPAATVSFGGRAVGELFVLPHIDAPPLAVAPLIAGVNRSLWRAIAIALLVALLASIVLARSIAQPLVALRKAAQKIAAGDLHVRVPVTGGGELAVLSRSFNALVDEIERTENLRRQMVGDVAHELRSPLTNVMAQIEAIQDGHLEPGAAMASIHDEALGLARLVDDLRDLSLADAGQLTLHAQPMSVRDAIEHTVRNANLAGPTQRVDVRSELPLDVPDAFADPIRVRQILQNLTENAIRCSADGGVVRIGATATDTAVQIFVGDDGCGISAEEVPKIFERFYRVDRSRARSTGGAGLGLAIVKQLTELQGGSVSVESSIGVGSRFCVTLPRA
jgi:signal transduction histidine kinase